MPFSAAWEIAAARISLATLRGKSGRLFAATLFAQKFVHIHQTRSGENAFVTDVPVAARQKLQQFDLQIALRREVRVSTFAGKNLMLAAIPEQSGLSQPGSGRDDRLIPDRLRYGIERSEIL